jgi:hypothetical protein
VTFSACPRLIVVLVVAFQGVALACSVEDLTRTLIERNDRYQSAGSREQRSLLTELVPVAADRQRCLAALLDTDPGAVMRAALPESLRASFPPAVQTYIEERVDLEGVLEVLHEDREKGSRYLYFLQTPKERVSLHFVTEPPALTSGARVRITGVRIGTDLVL